MLNYLIWKQDKLKERKMQFTLVELDGNGKFINRICNSDNKFSIEMQHRMYSNFFKKRFFEVQIKDSVGRLICGRN